MSSLSPSRRWLLSVAAVSTLALTSACGIGGGDDDSTDSSSAPSTPAESSAEAPAETDAGTDDGTDDGTDGAAAGAFTAGEYDEDGSYNTPGGEQSIEVDVTIDADGTITAIQVTPEAESGNSVQFQGQFADGIADEVMGQKIDELSVSKVAGSSLTSGGFNAAIAEIIAEAQA